MDWTIDKVERPRQKLVVFSMPNKNPGVARERKREWYQQHKEEILKPKRERRAAQKKAKPPAPTPEQIARRKALNKEACQRYRATHLAQVRFINRDYYHRNRDRIVQQQRNRRALAKQTQQNPEPFRKLRALADVCSARLIELDHGYARKEEGAGPNKDFEMPKTVSSPKAGGRGRHRGGEGW